MASRELRTFLSQAAIVTATTVGAGMFALPYSFALAGWGPGLFFLSTLAVILGYVHAIYFSVLQRVGERRRLTGLVRDVFGRVYGAGALVAVVAGQIFSLLLYIIIGVTFLRLLVPEFPIVGGVMFFWIIATLPLFFPLRKFVRMEVLGVAALLLLVMVFVMGSDVTSAVSRAPLVNWEYMLFPFGLILFSLAGWTAVEPVYELGVTSGSTWRRSIFALVSGTGVSAFIYIVFILAILGFPANIMPDTVSAFSDSFYRIALGVLGLFAIWTSYIPVGREASNALIDYGWRKKSALCVVAITPLLLFFVGLSDFSRLVGLVGGVFLAVQYLFIIAVGKKLLMPRGTAHVLYMLLFIILGAGVLYELYYFFTQ
ncbi:MAG: hypothetical protein NUV53_04775 [Patescibacteria group bacterium]|nr:hypothetical protein [Patescibacteria group bacterium]